MKWSESTSRSGRPAWSSRKAIASGSTSSPATAWAAFRILTTAPTTTPEPTRFTPGEAALPTFCFPSFPASRLALVRIGADIVPELVDFLAGESAFPGRHLALAVVHRDLESRTVFGAQAAQIECLARADQILAVTSEAIVVVDPLAGPDFLAVLRKSGPQGQRNSSQHNQGADERTQPQAASPVVRIIGQTG